ncbi:MAG TPA: hypothetical protein VFF12_04710, partial [Myxococcaceae bacterium]|nr:hypothetical protein [Myxococcaceae bacterium]
SPAPPVPDWSIEDVEPAAVPLALAPGLAAPPGPLLVGAEVVPPRSVLPDRELCSHAPNARAPATARIPIMSLRFISFSRVAPSMSPGRFLEG